MAATTRLLHCNNMTLLAFAGALPLARSTRGAAPALSPRRAPTAALDLVPGIPPGEDARENAPLRYYVPRPAEDYSDRSFSTPLPVTWAGETGTIGVADVDQSLTAEKIAESKLVPEDAASTGALAEYARMVAEDRRAALAKFQEKVEVGGRPTCGESEGRGIVSNYRPELLNGTDWAEQGKGWGEYWARKAE